MTGNVYHDRAINVKKEVVNNTFTSTTTTTKKGGKGRMTKSIFGGYNVSGGGSNTTTNTDSYTVRSYVWTFQFEGSNDVFRLRSEEEVFIDEGDEVVVYAEQPFGGYREVPYMSNETRQWSYYPNTDRPSIFFYIITAVKALFLTFIIIIAAIILGMIIGVDVFVKSDWMLVPYLILGVMPGYLKISKIHKQLKYNKEIDDAMYKVANEDMH